MNRSKPRPPTESAPAQLSLLPPDAAAVLHLVRENLRLLADLTRRYEAPRLDPPAAEPAGREFFRAEQVAGYLGPELEGLAQEQIRALLLDARGRLLRTVLVCQGGLNVVHAHPVDCLREAVRTNAAY